MIQINDNLTAAYLSDKLKRFWEISRRKIRLMEKNYDESEGSPVFTV